MLLRDTLVVQMVKRLPTMPETWVQSLGWEDLLEKEMATHSSILAWKIPWTEEPGRLSPWGRRVGHDWVTSLSVKKPFESWGDFLNWKKIIKKIIQILIFNLHLSSFLYNFLILKIKCAATAAKSLQSCLTLCDPTDGSPPGSPVPGILQSRTLEWVAISFSNAWKWKVKVKLLSRVQLFTTPWTVAHQVPPSMEFPRPEDWRGVPLPSPLNVLNLCN